MSLAVIGSVFVDIKGYPTEKFLVGGRNAGTVEQVHGGVARNIAEDIAHAGEAVTFIGLADESSAGADVIAHLASVGVDTTYMRRTADGMGTWLAVFNEHNDVVAAISKRPDLLPICGILNEQGDEIFAASDGILLEFDLEQETVEAVYRLAEKHQKPVYAAVSNMRIALENRAYLTKTACFVCNEQEADILFPGVFRNMTPEEMPAALQAAMKSADIASMVVTMAERGAVYASTETCGRIPAKPVKVADSTGAGDAFFAGVCVGLNRGASLRKACSIGAELAAQVISSTANVCPDMALNMEENA